MIDLNEISINPAIALKFPAQQALRFKLLPFCLWQDQLHVACNLIPNSQTKRVLETLYGVTPKFIQVDESSLQESLQELYSSAAPSSKSQKIKQDSNIVLSEKILDTALLQQVSDVHHPSNRKL